MVGKYIILLILGLLISLDSYSQDSTFWMELMQPEAGKINKFYIDKIGNLFICSDNGLFKSTNDGISWKRIYLSNLSAIAIDSSNNIYLFDKNHLIYSNDFGESWLEKNSADSIISNSNIIGFDGFNILYCMRKMKYGVQNALTFYISSDFGTSWAVRNYKFNLPSDYTNLFEFLDVKGTLITGGYYNVNNKSEGVIFISNDTGNSWEMVINIPVPYNIGYYNFASFFLGTSSGLYYTSNGGKDWKIQFADKAVSVDLVNNDDIFITTIDRKYHSSNKGISWEEINWTFDYDLRPIYYKSDQCIYGSAYNIGFYISKDKGLSWEQSNKGFSAANVYDICEDSKGDLYSVGDFGIYKSTDEGRSWLNIGFYGYRLSNIIIGKDNYIYVSNSIPHVIQGTIFRSTNGGMTWEDKSKGLVWQSGIQVLVHDIFITKQGHILLGTPFDEYWESTDNGESWIEKNVEGYSLCFAYNSEGHLFRGGDDGIFYRSTDEGQTWEKMKKADNYHSYEFYSMVFSPYSQVGFASGFSPIWNGAALCYKTIDNGRSWKYCDECYCSVLGIDSLGSFIEPWSRSLDHDGEQWTGMLTGLQHSKYNKIFTSQNGYIYLAANNGGLYRSRDRYVSVPETQEPPGSKDRLSASPNPFSDETSITFTLDAPGEVTISLYDMLGRQVADIYHGYRDEGRHSMQLLITNYELPINPGVYLLRLETQKEVLVSKVIIIK